MLLSPDLFSIVTTALDILAGRGVFDCHLTINCLSEALSNKQGVRAFPIFIVMAVPYVSRSRGKATHGIL